MPHHLIDVVDPTEAYSAARFRADAIGLVGEIVARGRVPLFVGGTMLYFKALRDGLSELPAADPGVRAAIDAEARRRGWPALHAELARVDPETAGIQERQLVGIADHDQGALVSPDHVVDPLT